MPPDVTQPSQKPPRDRRPLSAAAPCARHLLRSTPEPGTTAALFRHRPVARRRRGRPGDHPAASPDHGRRHDPRSVHSLRGRSPPSSPIPTTPMSAPTWWRWRPAGDGADHRGPRRRQPGRQDRRQAVHHRSGAVPARGQSVEGADRSRRGPAQGRAGGAGAGPGGPAGVDVEPHLRRPGAEPVLRSRQSANSRPSPSSTGPTTSCAAPRPR